MTVDYPHIRPRAYVRPAKAVVRPAALLLPPLARVGYVRGASDRVPEALRSVGVPLTLLDAQALERGDLGRYQAIIVGPAGVRDRFRAGREQRPAARVRAPRRTRDRAVPAATVLRRRLRAVSDDPGRSARPGDRRDRSGAIVAPRRSGCHHAQPDRQRTTGAAGSRSADSTSRGAGTRRIGPSWRPTIPARRRSREGCCRAGGQGEIRLHRAQLFQATAGRRAGCVPALRESAGAVTARTAMRRGRRSRAIAAAPAVFAAFVLPTADTRTPIVLYSPHGRDQLTLLENAFEAKHPDIDVRWLDMGSQEILDRLRFERVNPQADVWFGGPDHDLRPWHPRFDSRTVPPRVGRSCRPRWRGSGRSVLSGVSHARGDRVQQPIGVARVALRTTGTMCSTRAGTTRSSSAIRWPAAPCAPSGV